MSEKSIDKLLNEIRSGEPDRISEAYHELLNIGDDAVSALSEGLNDDAALVRWAAAGVLGDIGAESAVPELEERLDDENVSVRVRAAQSLGKLGSTEGIPVLIEALRSDEVMIGHPPELASDYAAQVLRNLTDEAFEIDPSAPESERSAAIRRWEEWWDEHEDHFEL